MQRYGGWLLLATVVLVASGCSPADQFRDRVDVTGTVKHKGQPIKDGAIIDFFAT